MEYSKCVVRGHDGHSNHCLISLNDILSITKHQDVELNDTANSDVVQYHPGRVGELNDFENLRASADEKHSEELLSLICLAHNEGVNVVAALSAEAIILRKSVSSSSSIE